jgi:hypothetical protein
MPILLATVLADMHHDPLAFMRHYRLSIAGGAANSASGVYTFFFWDQVGTVPGFTTGLSGRLGIRKDRALISFRKCPYDPNPVAANGYFNAHYVSMEDDNALGATYYTLPRNGPTSDANPDIMLTSQLSNCTFGIGSAAPGSQLVCHVQAHTNFLGPTDPNNPNFDPNDPTGEAAGRSHLKATVQAGLIAGGTHAIYHREDENKKTGYGKKTHRATIIGIRNGTNWSFFAQTYRDTSAKIKDKAVLEARQL